MKDRIGRQSCVLGFVRGSILVISICPLLGQSRLPPPLGASDCSATAPARELPNARFTRKGGRRTQAEVHAEKDGLTVPDVAQERDLGQYDALALVVDLMHPQPPPDAMLARARTFLFEHWSNHKQAYLKLTGGSVDAISTSHIFIEQDGTGRWRIAWRIVRDHGEVDDLPTYYSMQWITPGAWREPASPLPEGQPPDPAKNELQFRDVCGDVEQLF